MTDEELLFWLRVEDTDLTDFAAARIEALTKERDEARAAWELEAAAVKRFAERHERHLVLGAETRTRAERLEEALIWCSGSADFNEGGVARKGWLKVCAPLLKGESHD